MGTRLCACVRVQLISLIKFSRVFQSQHSTLLSGHNSEWELDFVCS